MRQLLSALKRSRPDLALLAVLALTVPGTLYGQAVSEVPRDEPGQYERPEAAQEAIANDYVNGFLFQLAKTGVANAKVEGLWENAPTQAIDLTGVSWSE